MIRLLAAFLLVALAAAGCRAPGQPPHHPDAAAYADLMRREVATASSALGSAQLVIAQVRAGRITVTYAQVGLRQAADDLDGVATDLAQIIAPSGRESAQRRFQAIVGDGRRQLRAISQRWPDDRTLARAESSSGEGARRLDRDISSALGV
jgi:hypothetical protein